MPTSNPKLKYIFFSLLTTISTRYVRVCGANKLENMFEKNKKKIKTKIY